MIREPTGHVYRLTGARSDTWYAKYRLPDGRQVKKRIGPAWTSRGRPAAGFYTKRIAEAWLRDLLDEARRGTLPGMVRTGATFADAAAEYLAGLSRSRDCTSAQPARHPALQPRVRRGRGSQGRHAETGRAAQLA